MSAATELDRLAAREWNDAIPAGLPVGVVCGAQAGMDDECCHDVGGGTAGWWPPVRAERLLCTSLREAAAQAVVAEAAIICWRQRPRQRTLDA